MKLLPPQLITSILDLGEAPLRLVGGIPLLLVRISNPTGELAHWLAETTKRDQLTGQDSADTTVQMTRPIKKPAGPKRPHSPATHTLTPAALRKKFDADLQFALMLIKRDFSAMTSRIAIGRARSNDVVLYDPSVSSLHAWIDTDDDGEFFLIDNESTNGTRVNGQVVSKGAPVDIHHGDRIDFGKIETTLCSVRELREALEL